MRRLCIPCVVVACALAGCAPKTPMEPAPNVVRAKWDPSTGELPTPTDLVRDAQTGKLALPVDPNAPAADREFTAYLNSLDGYPLASTMKLPMSGAVQASQLPGAFFAIDAQTGHQLDLAMAFDTVSDTITATPTGGQDAEFLPDHTYVFGIRGYEGGLAGAHGEEVIADPGFYLVRSKSPLDEHPAAMPGATRAEREQTAQKLRQVQQAYAPLIDMAADMRGFSRDQLAVLGSFSTTTQPAVWFDPDTQRIPLPNQLLIDPTTGKVDLPIADDDPAEVQDVKAVLSTYDGFADSGALVLQSTRAIDPDSVERDGAIRLFRKHEDGSLEEITDLEHGVLDDGKTFWIRPRLTLASDADYVYVVTDKLTGVGGQPLHAQPLGALLRSKAPLTDGGTSQVSVVDDATAQMLEPVRKLAKPVLDKLAGEGVARSTLAAAVPFHTVSAIKRQLARRAELYKKDVRTDIENVRVASPLERGLFVAMPLVKTVVTGQMYTYSHLDPHTRRFYPDGHGEETPVSFVLTIPAGAKKDKPMPVVLFGHGLMTSRELVYLIANKLAKAGYAAFCLDLPYHGKRAVCLKDTDCVGDATCNDVGQCIESDGSPGQLTSFHVPFVDVDYPTSTGFAFVEIDNLVGTRDHFAQAVIDLEQGLRVIRNADWFANTGGYKLDGQDVVYLGMSLGGIVGADLAAIEPTIKTFVLNVPGADYLTLIENSDTFRTVFNQALAARGVQRGSDKYFQFENMVRWLLDPVDPLNIAQHATINPVTYVDPVDGQQKTAPRKRVLIQMAKNDAVVPNVSTHKLADRMGLDISVYHPAVSNHGFLFDPTSSEGRKARNEMIEFFNGR